MWHWTYRWHQYLMCSFNPLSLGRSNFQFKNIISWYIFVSGRSLLMRDIKMCSWWCDGVIDDKLTLKTTRSYFWNTIYFPNVVHFKFIILICPRASVATVLSMYPYICSCLSQWPSSWWIWYDIILDCTKIFYIDGLVQDCSNSIANALDLLWYCAKPWS